MHISWHTNKTHIDVTKCNVTAMKSMINAHKKNNNNNK